MRAQQTAGHSHLEIEGVRQDLATSQTLNDLELWEGMVLAKFPRAETCDVDAANTAHIDHA